MLQTDVATGRRRQVYNSGQTLPDSPATVRLIQDDDEEAACESSRLIPTCDSPAHSGGSPYSDRERDRSPTRIVEDPPEEEVGDAGMGSTSGAGVGSAASSSGKSHRVKFQNNKRTVAASNSDAQLLPEKADMPRSKSSGSSLRGGNGSGSGSKSARKGSGGRSSNSGSSSTPSMLLSKFKDRIRETVFQTSSEWTNAAAIMQERRQRSVDAFAARLSQSAAVGAGIGVGIIGIGMGPGGGIGGFGSSVGSARATAGGSQSGSDVDLDGEQIPLKDIHRNPQQPTSQQSGGSRNRMKSEPLPAVVLTSPEDMTPAEAARLAFRRRSISEDTYDRRPCLPIKQQSRGQTGPAGIICSNEDLQAIVTDHRRRSPRSGHKRSSLEPRGSFDSSSSTYSSRSWRTESADGEALARRESQLSQQDSAANPSPVPSAQYPEVILDNNLGPRQGASAYQRKLSSNSTCSAPGGGSVQSPQLLQPTVNGDRLGDNRGSPDITIETDHCRQEPCQIPEIVFDEFGQTWDVYGAEFDPEILGDAIQKHLENLMQRRESELPSLEQARSVPECGEHADVCPRGRRAKSRHSLNYILRFLCLFTRRRDPPRT